MALFAMVICAIYCVMELRKYRSFLTDKSEASDHTYSRFNLVDEIRYYSRLIFRPTRITMPIRLKRTINALRLCAAGIVLGGLYMGYNYYF